MTERRQEHERLSPQGQARREAMLGQLVGEMSLVHRRRRVRQRALSSTAIVLLLFAVFRYASFDPAGQPMTSNQQISQPTMSLARDATIVVYVNTDPGVIERFRADPRPIIVHINDSELIEMLAEIGRPAGLVHFGERLALSAPVTDKELGMSQDR